MKAIVRAIDELCLCGFGEQHILSYEVGCRSDPHGLVFRAELLYNGPKATNQSTLLGLVSNWIGDGASLLIDSVRYDIDPSCPLMLESFDDGECIEVLPSSSATTEPSTTVDATAHSPSVTVSFVPLTPDPTPHTTASEQVFVLTVVCGVLGAIVLLLLLLVTVILIVICCKKTW